MRAHPLNTAHAIYLLTNDPNPLATAVIDYTYRRACRKGLVEVADDLAQQAAIQVWRYLPAYRLSASFLHWVAAIVTRLIAYHYRSLTPTDQLDPERHVTSHTAAPAAQSITLSDEDRQLLTWRIDGYTYVEIGKWLGITPAAARMRVNKLRQKFPSFSVSAPGEHLNKCRQKNEAGARETLATQPSLAMGPDTQYRYADGDPMVIPLVDAWRPTFKVICCPIPDTHTVFSA